MEKKNALENLQEIEKNVDYINKIVADLQDYAKTINPATQKTDLEKPCVKNCFKEKKICLKTLRLHAISKLTVKTIVVDSILLKRILGNRVMNGIQAMPNGGKLKLMAHLDGEDIVIAVQDTGVWHP